MTAAISDPPPRTVAHPWREPKTRLPTQVNSLTDRSKGEWVRSWWTVFALGTCALASAAAPAQAAFPGVNGKIAFSHRDAGGDWEIYVMNADGSGQTNITIYPGVRLRPCLVA